MNKDDLKKATEVATAIPYNPEKEKFLLTKRTEDTEIHPGKWDFPGGHIENEDPRKAALRELNEEANLKGDILRSGEPFNLDTEDGLFKIYPFLIIVKQSPRLNEEHTDYEWIEPQELENYRTVKGLEKDLKQVGVLEN